MEHDMSPTLAKLSEKMRESMRAAGEVNANVVGFADRSPTTIQKASMAKNIIDIECMHHYSRIYAKDEIKYVRVPGAFSDSFRALLDDSSLLNPEEFMLFSNLILRFTGKPEIELLQNPVFVHEFLRTIRPTIFGGIPIVFDPNLHEIEVIASEGEDTIITNQIDINNPFAISKRLFSHGDAQYSQAATLFLIHLYMIDLFELLLVKRGSGEQMKRILPHFASKELNNAIFQKFSNQLKLIKLMMLDGVELKDITREGLREYLERVQANSKKLEAIVARAPMPGAGEDE